MSFKNGHDVSASLIGGFWVVINLSGVHQSDTTLEVMFVYEYVHVILRVNDFWLWGSGDPVFVAITEGVVCWFEVMFYFNLVTANGILWSLNVLRSVIEFCFFNGKVFFD